MQSKNMIVVGGSRGIGLGIVERCVAQGAQVYVLARHSGDLQHMPQVRFIPFDATTDELTAEQLPETIHGWVYCPGSIQLAPLRSVTLQTMRDDFELNVLGAVRCMQAALPGMKAAAGASAVLFSSVAAQRGLQMHSSVAAAKAAVEALVRTWAAELAPAVRVNCIAPALTDTPLAERFLSTPPKRQAMASKYPLARVGEVGDMAAAAEFLLSENSSWITGQVLAVDGGMSALG